MFELFLEYIKTNTEWLSCRFFEYKLFYYDLWSFVHLWSGAMIFVVLTAFKFKKRWLKLLFLLTLWKVIQTTIIIASSQIFNPEILVDAANDIAIGMLGGLLMYTFFRWNNKKSCVVWLAAFLSSIPIAFIWVGSYGYNYNIYFFNSNCINWWALTSWSLGGAAMALIFYLLNERMNMFYSLLITYAIHIAFLLSVESIAYHLFSFKEESIVTKPLIFNLIHGNLQMHIFYSTAPIYFTMLFFLLFSLFKKYKASMDTKIHQP